MIFRNLYRPTASKRYVRFIQQNNSAIWDNTAVAMATLPLYADSSILLVEVAGHGIFPIVIPTDLPKGVIYDAVIYTQAGGSPANSDSVDVTYELKRGGDGGFGF